MTSLRISPFQSANKFEPASVIAIALISIAPIFRGGNRFVPLTLIEWLALLLVPLLAWQVLGSANGAQNSQANASRAGSWGLLALATSPLWVGLLQLGPLALLSSGGELGLASWFGPGDMAATLGPAAQETGAGHQAVWASVLAGVPIAVCFVLALALPKEQVKLLSRVWIAAAVVQALLGLAQTTGAKSLYFDYAQAYGSIGTFANRNHLANFIAMTLPWVILELRSPARRHRSNSRKPWLWGAVLFVLFAALLATMSRMGIATGLLVALLAFAMMAPKKGGTKTMRRWTWAAGLALLALALVAGGWNWLTRFDADYLEKSALFRENLRQLTWDAAMAYWPLGSGMGTFTGVFPAFQNSEATGFVNYAHNDYLQLLLELGVVFVGLLLLAGASMVQRAWRLSQSRLAGAGWQQADFFAVASGLGFAAIALHGWVDFPARIPANAMLGAFLLGAFLRPEPSQGFKARTAIKNLSPDETHV